MPPVDNAYKLRNQEFLQEYAQRPGVKIMFNGVMYREIVKGKGQKPSPKSFVTVYYTGKLINGKIFDQTQKGRPATFRLNELITGWITAKTGFACSAWILVTSCRSHQGILYIDIRHYIAGCQVDLSKGICGHLLSLKFSISFTISSVESLMDSRRLLYLPLSVRYFINL